jgi:hypothetical protein
MTPERIKEFREMFSDDKNPHPFTAKIFTECLDEIERLDRLGDNDFGQYHREAKALADFACENLRHDSGCHPSEDRHSKTCLEGQRLISTYRASKKDNS